MIYVTADLHGCPLGVFQKLLDRAGFSEGDFLYILGDVIDRGPEGAQLLAFLSQQPNMELILGNHEAILLACGFLFSEVTEESLSSLTRENLALLQNWLQNGGAPTLTGLRRLLKEDPELLEGILDYLRESPLYEWVEAGGRRFLLVHGGLGNFQPDRPLEDYKPEELLWTRPEPGTRYFPDATVILGHTPTEFYGTPDRAFHGDGWINIDTSPKPMLLRLEDLRETYMNSESPEPGRADS